MEHQRASELLHDERLRIESTLEHLTASRAAERLGAVAQGDMNDSAEPLVAEQEDDAVTRGLEDRLQAIGRALQRLADGTYGMSVRSGLPIPDERLQADPAAELTIDEVGEQ
jgi:DnaK suppressor protein